MCSQYALKVEAKTLSEKYNVQIPALLSAIDERFLPYKTAPVIVRTNGFEKLTPMSFSLVPSWSKEPKVKFATHNARIETITEKPTWKIPFKKQHCVVPMTRFFESVYEGPLAGHIIEFSKANEDLLFAAGIFDRWNDTEKKGSLFSFSILTADPSPFIQSYGHDRCPIFLSYADAVEWLQINTDEKVMIQFLMDKKLTPELEVKADRPLKAGWEKRR